MLEMYGNLTKKKAFNMENSVEAKIEAMPRIGERAPHSPLSPPIAWLRTIKDNIDYKGMKNVEVKFPLIGDIAMDVAKKYGMIQPGEATTKAVCAVFVIDPKGINGKCSTRLTNVPISFIMSL